MKKLLLAIAALTPYASAQEQMGRWAHHRAIVLNTKPSGANLKADLTRFPVLVRLAAGDSVFRQARAGGADLRFTKADTVTPLPYEIEQWDSARGAAIWVLLDTVTANDSVRSFQMHWGRLAAASQSNGAAVFSSAAGFRAVWHLNDSANQTDVTGNGNTGFPSAVKPAPTPIAQALIGGAKTFNGSTNWYRIGADTSALNVDSDRGPYTLSAWVRPENCAIRIAVIAKYANTDAIKGRHYALHTAPNTLNWRFTNSAPSAVSGGSQNDFSADAPGTCAEEVWTHVAGTYRSGAPTVDSALNVHLYLNGALQATGTSYQVAGSIGTAAQAYIGRIATDERYMYGSLDEIRVHSVMRDSNWLKLEVANQVSGHLSFRGIRVPFIADTVTGVRAASRAPELRIDASEAAFVFAVEGLASGERAALSVINLKGRMVFAKAFRGEVLKWTAPRAGTYLARLSITDARGARVVAERKLSIVR